MGQRSLRDAVIKIKGGGSEEVTVKIGDGNISWTEKRALKYTHDRGEVSGVRLEDDEPCEVKFDFVWDWFQSLSGDSVYEAINGMGTFTTTGEACEPYAVDIVVEMYGCGAETTPTETITFSDFRYTDLSPDLRNSSIACSGSIKALRPTFT